MDILESVAIEVPCSACGGRYEVTLKQIALSQQMLHEGCPVQVVDECPRTEIALRITDMC
jgi:hypothetical protein